VARRAEALRVAANFGRAGKTPVMAVFRLVRCCKKENDFLTPEFFYGARAEIDAF
jgi:hypothetical protein